MGNQIIFALLCGALAVNILLLRANRRRRDLAAKLALGGRLAWIINTLNYHRTDTGPAPRRRA